MTALMTLDSSLLSLLIYDFPLDFLSPSIAIAA